jgi:hypothetical protein
MGESRVRTLQRRVRPILLCLSLFRATARGAIIARTALGATLAGICLLCCGGHFGCAATGGALSHKTARRPSWKRSVAGRLPAGILRFSSGNRSLGDDAEDDLGVGCCTMRTAAGQRRPLPPLEHPPRCGLRALLSSTPPGLHFSALAGCRCRRAFAGGTDLRSG